jgi:hypothetical protein
MSEHAIRKVEVIEVDDEVWVTYYDPDYMKGHPNQPVGFVVTIGQKNGFTTVNTWDRPDPPDQQAFMSKAHFMMKKEIALEVFRAIVKQLEASQ